MDRIGSKGGGACLFCQATIAAPVGVVNKKFCSLAHKRAYEKMIRHMGRVVLGVAATYGWVPPMSESADPSAARTDKNLDNG